MAVQMPKLPPGWQADVENLIDDLSDFLKRTPNQDAIIAMASLIVGKMKSMPVDQRMAGITLVTFMLGEAMRE